MLCAFADVWIADCQGPIVRSGFAGFKVADVARAVAEWAQRRNIESAVMVGHSYGAQVAVHLALEDEKLVDRLVLIAPPIDPAGRKISLLAGRLLRDAFHEPVSLILIAASCYLKNGVRAWKMLSEALQVSLERSVGGLRQPALFILGARDTVVPGLWTAQLAGLTNNASLITIPRAAHGVVFSFARKVAAAVLRFACHGDCGPTACPSSRPEAALARETSRMPITFQIQANFLH
jgi:pimeloyl-ACP methyl ester carboxylesterase